MEDIDFSRRLKRKGAIAALTATVTTSFRRWEQHGPLRTILLMWALTIPLLDRRQFVPAREAQYDSAVTGSMSPCYSHPHEFTSQYPAPLTHTAFVIFAKAPIPGEVKTRLCPPLTPDEAATLHGSFVLDMLERSKTAVAKLKLPLDRYLACTPSSTLVFFKIMEERQGVKLIDQTGADLGSTHVSHL